MQRPIHLALAVVLALSTIAAAGAQEGDSQENRPQQANPQVVLETSEGTVVVELYADQAPITVKNFLGYVESGYFAGAVCHRVIPDFMVQCGGFTADLTKKETRGPIQNEADNGLTNERGTLAMARTGDPHSASAQFFINLVDNDNLNHTGKNPRGWGYAVFGVVVEGMEAVDAIAAVATGTSKTSDGMPMQNVPLEAVSINQASVKE